MKALLSALRRNIREDTTDAGEEGRWITVRGKPIFIGSADPTVLDDLKPGDDVDRGKVVTKFTRKDGTEGESVSYGDDWKQRMSRYKFSRVAALEEKRQEIEDSLEADIAMGGTSMQTATATALLLISRTGMRPGTPGSVSKNKKTGRSSPTFGAHSIQRRHVKLDGDKITLSYKGKSGVNRLVKVEDPVLAKSIRTFMGGKDAAAGDKTPLFKTTTRATGRTARHLQSGGFQVCSPSHVGRRLKRHNKHFKPKDMRTAMAMRMASQEAAKILERTSPLRIPKAKNKAATLARSYIQRIAKRVSGQLGNTPSVAIKQYTSPEVVEHVLERLGFTPEHVAGVAKAFRESADDVQFAARTRALRNQGFPILVALLGPEAMESWQGSWLDERRDEGDIDDVPVLGDEDLDEANAYLDRIAEMAGL